MVLSTNLIPFHEVISEIKLGTQTIEYEICVKNARFQLCGTVMGSYITLLHY